MATVPRRLYVQCNPLLDISATVDDAFMNKYKLEKASASLVADWQMGIYEDLEENFNIMYIPGGAGLNTARVAQWMSRAPKSSFVTFVGCIADDKYGKILKSAAEADGVVMLVEYNNTTSTGRCAVCLRDKERSLVAHLGASSLLSSAHMHSSDVVRALQECDVYYFTGFTVIIDVAYVLQAAEAARNHNGVFTFNISAPYIVQLFTDRVKAVLPYVDILFGNETEAKALASLFGWNKKGETQSVGAQDSIACSDANTDNVNDESNNTNSNEEMSVLEIAQRAAVELPYNGTFDRLIIFTQGCAPTVYASRSGACGEVPVKLVPKEKLIDTNAGGDAFVGGFLAAFARNQDVRRCCEAGNYAGAEIIQHDGCTFPEIPKFTIEDCDVVSQQQHLLVKH